MVKRAMLALTAAGVILASPILAHAKLQSSSPAADAQLTRAPKSLTLEFNEEVELASLKLAVDGKDIAVAFDRGAAAARRVSVALPSLAAGTYQVQWSALSPDDGHIAKGAFSFVIR